MVTFVQRFWLVFENDWDFTRANLVGWPDDSSTFIDPGLEDESNNWANRGSLLSSYREAIQRLEAVGLNIVGP